MGWDLTLFGLSTHLQGRSVPDPTAWQLSTEARDFITRSSLAWGTASEQAGAPAADARAAVERTTAFYAPEPDSASSDGAAAGD